MGAVELAASRGTSPLSAVAASVRRWVRVLWVCRIPTLSALAGVVLFNFVAQGRDLFLDFPGSGGPFLSDHGMTGAAGVAWYAARFAILVLLLWALPTHAAARLALNQPDWLASPYLVRQAVNPQTVAAFARPVAWTPRLLGLVCFIAPLAGILRARHEMLVGVAANGAETTERASAMLEAYAFGLVIVLAAYVLYVFGRRAAYNMLQVRFGRSGFQPRPSTAGRDGGDPVGDLVDTSVLWIVFIAQMAILLALPVLDPFRRLALTPVLLGAWTPFLSWVARRSYATRLPLMLGLVTLALVLTYLARDAHEIATIGGGSRPTIRAAVEGWMQANRCAGAARDCPSPIIVASAGGASRASFVTASTLGLLLDLSCVQSSAAQPPAGCADAPEFGKRLFAISSVSGASVGAAFFAAAYADAGGKGGAYAAPCLAGRKTDLWFGGSEPGNWRACLETIAAEDFLTPVFAGLGFRDVLSFLSGVFPGVWQDRGALFEKAVSRAYAGFALAQNAQDTGMDRPFLALAPQSADRWRPLLLLNSTSVDTGRRIVQSQVAASYLSKRVDTKRSNAPPCIRMFSDAYDLHELATPAPAGQEFCAPMSTGLDLRAVSAAHNSARFPFVSPVGAFRADGKLLGRLADGGYFDNYGALTAFDLVDVLRSEFDLAPFVILITNDPSDALNTGAQGRRWYSAPPPAFAAPPNLWAPFVTAPVDTIMATRAGHGSTAVSLLRNLLDPDVAGPESDAAPAASDKNQRASNQFDPSCFGLAAQPDRPAREPCFAHLAVRGQLVDGDKVKAVSMSWWLSKPVQQYLNENLVTDPGNRAALELICDAVMRRANPGDPQDQSGAETCRQGIPTPVADRARRK